MGLGSRGGYFMRGELGFLGFFGVVFFRVECLGFLDVGLFCVSANRRLMFLGF